MPFLSKEHHKNTGIHWSDLPVTPTHISGEYILIVNNFTHYSSNLGIACYHFLVHIDCAIKKVSMNSSMYCCV